MDLNKKITQAEYLVNREAISAEVARADAKWITETLGMRQWREHHDGACAYPTQAFWRQWRADRIQIDKRILQVDKQGGKYIVYTYRPELVALLLGE